MVMLGTSGDFGVCYVETKSLGKGWVPFISALSSVSDGETNLKHKVAIADVNRLFSNDEDATCSRGQLRNFRTVHLL